MYRNLQAIMCMLELLSPPALTGFHRALLPASSRPQISLLPTLKVKYIYVVSVLFLPRANIRGALVIFYMFLSFLPFLK